MPRARRPSPAPAKAPRQAGSAIFLSERDIFHADRCEPLVAAGRRGEVRVTALARRGYPGREPPAGLLPEISTVGFWDAPGPQCWGLDWHRNEGIELTFLSRGRTAFQVEDQAYDLESGHLTITRPWQRHRVGNPNIGPTRLHWLILDVGMRRPNQTWRWPAWLLLTPADRLRLTTLLSHNEQPVWRADAEIAACFERLAVLVRDPGRAALATRLQLCVNDLFLAVLDLLQARKVRLDPRLVSTRRTVEMFLRALPDHLGHLWTLDEMAERCGLGRSRFADHCRHILNMAPMEYLTRCRLEAARQMLREEPERSITEISLACGFQTSQYFATVFRQHTGQTPKACREGQPSAEGQ